MVDLDELRAAWISALVAHLAESEPFWRRQLQRAQDSDGHEVQTPRLQFPVATPHAGVNCPQWTAARRYCPGPVHCGH